MLLIWNMLSSKVGVQKVEENTPQLPRADSKTLKSVSLISKAVPVWFMFPFFLVDLDKKYENEIELDEK